MPRRLLISILVIAAPLSGVLVAQGRASGAAVDRFGMNTLSVMSGNATQVGQLYDEMHAVGVSWIRADFEWSGIEPFEGQFNWARTDVAVDQARSRGIDVLATLDYTPSWARTNQTSDHYPPDDPDDYARFAKATVERYKDRVHYWEIWNEPNYWQFWLPKPDVVAYTTLLKKAYAAIKSADANATVMVGGLVFGTGDNRPTTFLKSIYANNGGRSDALFDAVAWHPYCRTRDPTLANAPWCAWHQMLDSHPSARSIMVAHGDRAKQIWPTEYGVCTGGIGDFATSENRQAATLKIAYDEAGRRAYLGPMFWYNWQDSTSDQSQNAFEFCGLKRVDGAKKPAWAAYRTLATGQADTEAPTDVAIFTPANGSTVSGAQVVLGASADDDVGVAKVVFFDDAGRLGAGVPGFGYAYAWDSTTVADGPRHFFVKAYDAAGNVTTSATVTLNVENQSLVLAAHS